MADNIIKQDDRIRQEENIEIHQSNGKKSNGKKNVSI